MSSETRPDTSARPSDEKDIVRVENLGKCYQIYDKPEHRLLQMFSFGRRQYFKEFWALRDLSFSLRKGESIGILGKNGSGKSTLLQIITGVLSPTCGNLVTHGRIAALLELGSGFNPEFTGRENAYLNGAILGLSREEMNDLMPEIERFAGVGDFFDRPTKLYSTGMILRVAFAVQAQVKPDILIVDEALAVGDALFQKRCFQKISQLLNDGTSLLLVSHDIDAIRCFTQKALLLNCGKTLAYDNSDAVILAYKALQAEEQNSLIEIQRANFQTEKSSIVLENDKTSFSNGNIILHGVTILNREDVEEHIFYPKDRMSFDVCIETTVDLENLFVSITLINAFGIKVYAWGTWNQDNACHKEENYDVIFKKTFRKGMKYVLRYQCECNLGVGFYEVQIGIALADSIDSGGVQDNAWYREAAFFEVKPLVNYSFGGLCDMKMSVIVLESTNQ